MRNDVERGVVMAGRRAHRRLGCREGGLLVSSGLRLQLLEADGSTRWAVDVPFKVHAACASQGTIGMLAAHGFFLLNTSDGSMVNEGRSAPGGFSDLHPRPGGGWALAGRRGEITSSHTRPRYSPR